MTEPPGSNSYWNRSLYGRRKRKVSQCAEAGSGSGEDGGPKEAQSQDSLQNLRGLVKGMKGQDSASAVEEFRARRSAIVSKDMKQTLPCDNLCFSKASSLIPKERVKSTSPTDTPGGIGKRRRGVLHSALPPGGTESTKADLEDDMSNDLEPLRDLIDGEVTEQHVKQIMSMRLEGDAMRVSSEDIGGLEKVKRLILTKIILPIKRPELHVGLYQASRGILFFGPPGTGKTTLAKWIATESGATFFNVTASSLISKYHGETETLVKCLFRVAEKLAPSIIFIDEIDGLVGKRREKEEDSTLRMKNQLLQAMDGIGTTDATIVVIGATNRPDALDEAALRRLCKRVYIPLPDIAARAQQLGNILTKHKLALNKGPGQEGSAGTNGSSNDQAEISHDDLVQIAEQLEGYNGSDLRAICVKAAEFVYEEVLNQYAGVDKIPGPECFRAPNKADLLEAIKYVRRSAAIDSCASRVSVEAFGREEEESGFGALRSVGLYEGFGLLGEVMVVLEKIGDGQGGEEDGCEIPVVEFGSVHLSEIEPSDIFTDGEVRNW